MADFSSRKAFRTFADYVKHKGRHILDSDSQSFLDTVISTSAKRTLAVQTGTMVWRAQLGHEGWSTAAITDGDGDVIDTYDVPEPYESKRMVPRTDRAYEGRVNPKGISCFYFSTDDTTAVAEVRPWVGAYVTVSEFKILRDPKLADCSGSPAGLWLGSNKDAPENIEKYVWDGINRAFTEPVTRADDVADYAPTQVIAEALRFNGFDGIMYGSALGKGKTVAVFDLEAATVVSRYVYEVTAIDVKSSLAANPYYYADWDGRAPRL